MHFYAFNLSLWLCIFMQTSEKWKIYIIIHQGNVSVSLYYPSFGHSDYLGCGFIYCMQTLIFLRVNDSQLFFQLFCIWRNQPKHCSFRWPYQERVWKYWKSCLHPWTPKIHTQNPSLACHIKLINLIKL